MLWPLVTSYRTPDLPWIHMLEKVCPPMKRFLEEHVPYFMETPCVLEKILLFASYFSRNLFFVPCFIQCIIWINWINLYIYIQIYIYIHFCLSVVCDVYTSPHPYFFLIFYLHCSYKHHFSLIIIVYVINVIIIFILFLSILLVIREFSI